MSKALLNILLALLVACAACDPVGIGDASEDGSAGKKDGLASRDTQGLSEQGGPGDQGAADTLLLDLMKADGPATPKPDAPAPYSKCPPPGGKQCGSSGKKCTWGFNPSSCYYGKVRKAILKTVSSNPSWFKRDDTLKCDVVLTGYKTAYVAATVKNILGQGLCARVDPADDVEVQVKTNATYSEQFRIYSSAKCVRTGGGIYNGRNVPACW